MIFNEIFSKKNFLIFVIYLITIVIGLEYNILNGFFPYVAPSKNVTIIVTGLLYSEFEVAILIILPLVGKLAPTIGGEKVLFIGTLILGISSICFGLTYFLPAGLPFILASFSFRGIGAIGTSFSFMVNPAIIAAIGDSHKVCTLIGILGSLLAGGTMLGPTVGSILFKYGGYICPFTLIGAMMIVFSVIIISFFPNFKSTTVIEGKLSLFVSRVNFWVTVNALFMTSFTVGFQTACFFLYCKDNFKMSPIMSSLANLGDSLAFIILSPFIGMLNDAYPGMLDYSICFGLITAIVSLCFLGPLPFLGITPHISISVVANILFGIGDAFIYSPVFAYLLNIALNVGLPDDFITYSIVSSCTSFFEILGLALGPTVGVIMYTRLGYGYACGVLSLFMILQVFVIIIFRIMNAIFNIEKDKYNSLTLSGYMPIFDQRLNPNINVNPDCNNKGATVEDKERLLDTKETHLLHKT